MKKHCLLLILSCIASMRTFASHHYGAAWLDEVLGTEETSAEPESLVLEGPEISDLVVNTETTQLPTCPDSTTPDILQELTYNDVLAALAKEQTDPAPKKTNAKGPFCCKICNKSFAVRNNLSRHTRTHTGEKPYQCTLCKKCFTADESLNAHMRSHTGEKPYQCNICEKCFISNSNLNTHIKTHTGEKPHQCILCEKSFIGNATLNAHMRVHTGERPFQCDICEKSFKTKTHLNRHTGTHIGKKPHACSECGKFFSTRTHLRKHATTHLPKTADQACAAQNESNNDDNPE